MRAAILFLAIALVALPGSVSAQSIEFTHVPEWESYEDLEGRTHGVDPQDFCVAVYIYVVGQWWTKPYADEPCTPIAPDSTWVCDVTTGGCDKCATRYAAFLVPIDWPPPVLLGSSDLPDSLHAHPYAFTTRLPGKRVITFCGLPWVVKDCDCRSMGPGPNYFSDSEENVWVDPEGHLHLKIARRDDRWYSSEVILNASFGRGKYIFHIGSSVDSLNVDAVLGLFTWDEVSPETYYSEIDIELARWGEILGPNAQYVIQPWDTDGNRHQYYLETGEPTTHSFTWCPEEWIEFVSDDGIETLEVWTYDDGDTPPAGAENVRMNLWRSGWFPDDADPVEVVINGFEFLPADSVCEFTSVHEGGPAVPGDGLPTLRQNYPNPFGPSTVLEFETATRGAVALKVYDVGGRLVRTLAEGEFDPGPHAVSWDGRDDEGRPVASGTYFYELWVDDRKLTRRAVLLK